MEKLKMGNRTIIIGGLILSLELYALKLIQCLDSLIGEWNTYAFQYAKEAPVSIALFITAAIVIYGFILIILGYKEANKLEKDQTLVSDLDTNFQEKYL